VKAAFERLGGVIDLWQVAVKPGKPFVFGSANGCWLFGLPGNPVSALVTFWLLVRPALLRMQGATDVSAPTAWGTLAEPLSNSGRRRHFMRVRTTDDGRVHLAGLQGSHALAGLASANGLVDVLPNMAIAGGTPVKVLLLP
jgi:molybdopterin molybdotransferase